MAGSIAIMSSRPRRPRSRRAGTPHPVSEPARRSRRTRRVLLVDDEQPIRLLCRVNLAAAGMDVLEAPDGATALALARRERPDLVLLDVRMPEMNGWQVAEELAAHPATRNIPIVFLTAKAERADRLRGYDLGAVGYVGKPFDAIAIPELVDDVLQRIARGEREELRRELLGE